MSNVQNRTIFIRDNLEVMRGINSASVDLIYLDPPFNSKRMFEAPIGSQAAGASFKDAWTLDDVKEEWVTQIEEEHPALAHIITAAGKAHSEGMQAYLTWMIVRLMEMQRLLKPTGSIYLHCDPTASHYLKAAMDAVFGAENFRSEITWKRTTTHSDTKNWAAVNDIIFYYANSGSYLWNPQYGDYDQQYISTKYRYDDNDGRGRYTLDNMTSPNPRPNMMYEWKGHASPPKGWRYSQETMAQLDSEGRIWYPDSKERRPRLKRYLNEMPGRIQDTIWNDIAPVNSQAKERTGYPTQKPLALLERIIKASSNEGDVVLDPFCGCATACIAAERLGRQWTGIDISEKAYELVIDRMRREVSLGDEELPALFGTVVHRTDVPKRTDADAPLRLTPTRPSGRPTSRNCSTGYRTAVGLAAKLTCPPACWNWTISSPDPKAARTSTPTCSSSAAGATAPKAPAATSTSGSGFNRPRRPDRDGRVLSFPLQSGRGSEVYER